MRRGPLPRKAANRLKIALVGGRDRRRDRRDHAHDLPLRRDSWRFRLDSSDQLEVAGIRHVSHAQIMEVMGGDIGRNVFFIPLAERKKQLKNSLGASPPP